MNTITAEITNIEHVDAVHVVSFKVAKQELRMMGLELNEKLYVGSMVVLGAKATNIALGREKNAMLSISNQLEVRITKLIIGTLLARVYFDFEGEIWESLITKKSVERMDLHEGETVVAFIKSSELSIAELG